MTEAASVGADSKLNTVALPDSIESVLADQLAPMLRQLPEIASMNGGSISIAPSAGSSAFFSLRKAQLDLLPKALAIAMAKDPYRVRIGNAIVEPQVVPPNKDALDALMSNSDVVVFYEAQPDGADLKVRLFAFAKAQTRVRKTWRFWSGEGGS
jgi:hypothetical protein